MSTEVESRVAKLEFDNSRFESNAKNSITTLEALNKTLDNTGANKGLDRLSAQTKNFNLDNVSTSVQSLSDRFSTMGIVGMTVVQNLTNTLIGKATKAVNTVTSLIQEGGKRRALNIEQAKFQIKGLGHQWEDVEKQVDYAVNGTAYGLDEAARVAAQLLASGVTVGKSFDAATGNIDDMGRALRAISGVAAMTNSDYSSIGQIFTTVASQGRVLAMQLNQLSYKGLNATATISKYINAHKDLYKEFAASYREKAGKNDPLLAEGAEITEAHIRAAASKSLISFDIFSKAMDEAFGEHATAANETYAGSLSNVKAALARLGQVTQAAKFESLKDIFNALIPVINGVKAALMPLLEFIGARMKKNSGIIVDFLNSLKFDPKTEEGAKNVEKVRKVIQAIVDVADKGLGKVDAFVEKIKDFFKNSQVPAKVSGAFQSFAKEVKDFFETNQIVAKVSKGFKDLVEGVKEFAKSIDFAKGLEKLRSQFTGLKGSFSGIITLGTKVRDFFVDIFDVLKPTKLDVKDFFKGILGKLGSVGTSIGQFFKNFKNLKKNGEVLKEFAEYANAGFESLGKAIDKVKDVIIAFVIVVKDYLSQAKQNIDDFVAQLKDAFKPIADSFKEAGAKIIASLNPVKAAFESIKGFFKNLFTKKSDTSGVTGTASELTEKLTPIQFLAKVVQKSSEKTSEYLDKIITKFKTFVSNLKPIGTKLVNGIKNFFENFDFERFFSIIHDALTSGLLFNLNKILSTLNSKMKNGEIGKGLKGILDSVSDVLSSFSDKIKKDVKINALKQVAKTMLILAAALVVLTYIDPDKLAKALGAMAGLFAELSASLWVMSKAAGKADYKNIGAMAGVLSSLSVVMVALALVTKLLGEMDTNSMIQGLIGVTVLIGVLVGAMALLAQIKRVSTTLPRVVEAIQKIALVLVVLSLVTKLLGEMDTANMIQGLIGVTVLIGVMVGAMALMAKIKGVGKNLPDTIKAVVYFATAIKLLSTAVKDLGEMDTQSMIQGMVGVSILIGLMAGTMALLTQMNKGSDSNGLKNMAGVLAFSAAIIILAKAVQVFGEMDPETLKQGGIAVGVAIAALTVAMIALGQLGGTQGLAGAAGILVLCISLSVLAKTIKYLGSLEYDTIKQGLITLAIALGMVLVAGLLAMPIAPGLLALGTAISLIGSGCLMAGLGMQAFAIGLAMLTVVGAAGIGVFLGLLMGLIEILPELAAGLALAAVAFVDSFIEGFAKKAENIAKNVADLLLTLMNVLAEYVPKLAAKGAELIAGILRGIADNQEEITTAGMDIIINFLKGVNNRIDELLDVGTELIVTIIHGIGDRMDAIGTAATDVIVKFLKTLQNNIGRIVQAGWDFIIGLIDGISDSVSKNMPRLRAAIKRLGTTIKDELLKPLKNIGSSLYQKGKDAIDGFCNGIKDFLYKVFNWGEKIGSNAVDGAAKGQESSSPSKAFRRLAHYAGQGYILGVRDYLGKVSDSAGKMGTSAVSSMQSAISKVSDIITSDMSMAPTITPVLNLSEVQAGARTIGGMLNGQTLGISANIGAINALMAQRQSGNDNSDVVNAVNRLRRSIEDNPKVVNNVNGVTYDDGSNISNAVNDLIHAIVVEGRV